MTTIVADPRHGLKLAWQKGLQRWLTRSSMDEIMPNLFLGGSYAAETLPVHNPNRITSVLTVMHKNLTDATLEAYERHGIIQCFMRKRDERDENLLEIFGELCKVIEQQLRDGRRVLVHCAMGISRSVTVVCAYIMQRWGLKRTAARQMVKAKRNVASPNSGFFTQLKVWGTCEYDIRSPIAVDGVRPFKEEYQLWLIQFNVAKLEQDIKKRNEQSAPEGGAG